MKRKTKKDDMLLPSEGMNYYELYLEEREKRLATFNIDESFKDLIKEVEDRNKNRKEGDEELPLPSKISDLGIDIPKPGDLEKEYFQKFMESQKMYGTTLNKIINERYGKDFNEENYDHEEYLKDKELIHKKLQGK